MPGDSDTGQIILDHVEVVGLLAPLILRRVDLADARVDADLLQGAGIGEQQPLLGARRGENLEGERLARRSLTSLPPFSR